ncbi:hypothetical protein F4859DRAFT_514467 [Xylaria cf. heliscus]|nr:hypothetical protein F4859DRAFT_514467 [Xylaria cf. heliscus]
MASEDWKSDETGEGYSALVHERGIPIMMALRRLSSQRPWHSKIRLPIDADAGKGTDFYHFECHDLDCMIVVLRMFLFLAFEAEPEYENSAIMTCANHDFGFDRRADYLVKGMLAKKLFPEELKDPNIIDNINAVLPKMTFENLLNHPGIKNVIFGSPGFLLKSDQLFVVDPACPTFVETIHTSPMDEWVDAAQVNWDGIKPLGDTVSEQGHYINKAAENGTKIHMRYCAEPLFIRVMFTPDKDHRKNYDDVRQFTLRAPTYKENGNDEFVEYKTNSVYLLRAVVKMDPRKPVENPAEVRLYNSSGVMMLADRHSNNEYRSVIQHKNRPDSLWSLGDPEFKFMLFYRLWEGDDCTPVVPPMEYRPPLVVPAYAFPIPTSELDGPGDSEDDGSSTRGYDNASERGSIVHSGDEGDEGQDTRERYNSPDFRRDHAQDRTRSRSRGRSRERRRDDYRDRNY